ncbi:MAG TPA: HAD family hydrolase [Gammaproteobacteria bacterium]|nr:HAD family hydrolase [Gammaproteobacteria bacterium]
MTTATRIAMWSGPRNISTAMMRAWENRGDTAVWDEPLYAYYLHRTGVEHPGADEVIAAGETDWRKVVDRLTGPIPGGKPVFFQKQMTHHLLGEIDRGWMDRVVNCFLIRDPAEVVASYSRARENAVLEDVGIVQQAEIYDYLCTRSQRAPVVLDARDVLENPEATLKALCDAVGVAFTPRMLSWPAGRRESDGVWSKYWYDSVIASTGFKRYRRKRIRLSPQLEAIAEACGPHYRKLHQQRLVA